MKMSNRARMTAGAVLLAALVAMPAARGWSFVQAEPPAPPKAEKAPKALAAPKAAVAPRAASQSFTWQSAGGGSYLGIGGRDVKAERLAALKLQEERGVEVMEVDQDGPAAKGGLKEGDVILEFNGQRVESMQGLRRMLNETPAGRTAALGVSRGGKNMALKVELGERPAMRHIEVFRGGEFHMPEIPPVPSVPNVMVAPVAPGMPIVALRSPLHGLVVENLSQQLGEFFGVKGGEGVLVRSVEKGSPAEAAGFRAGDVILQVKDERIVDFSDFRRILRQQKAGTVPVRILRDKREQTLSLNIPERPARRQSRGMDLDLDLDLGELRQELERMRPEVQRLALKLGETTAREMRKNSAEIERALRDASRELERAMRQKRVEIEREIQRLRKEKQRVEVEAEEEVEAELMDF